MLRSANVSTEPFSLADFDERARAIVSAAEERGAKLVAEAEAGAARILAAAREEGLAAGREEGREAGRAEGMAAGREEAIAELRAEGEGTLAALAGVLRELRTRRAELLRSAEEDVLRFAVAVAEKVVLREIARLPEAVQALVVKGVGLVGARGDVTVEMNPDDLGLLGEISEELDALVGAEGRVSLVASPAMTRGGCRVRGAGAQADLAVETQIERIRDALLGDV